MATRDAVSDLIRGNIDAIILNVLSRGDSYGYEVLKEIAAASRGEYEMKEPSLYTSLKRLQGQGFVESYWGDETQGARRKYYCITDAGITELQEATERWMRVRRIIDRLLGANGGER
ncbi:PadR family transcriptional regulator [Collinsella intestinalis]|uniref:PadR family transcriptional regulator n=1 Tax=Collinsella intestinalis TaxID=147207 RepID=UPI0019597C9C|nr:PadR family transcriptional regulator [Collinsella intestinalis]MBM6908585.1 helix-turn-helix transcriptional regulator [Collinsella intestinalis]